MRVADWLMILAVLAGPIVAVQLTRYLDVKKEVGERKLWIFKKLMATRAYTLSRDHVEALNRIDLEFDRKRPKEKAVVDKWKEYLDLLGNRTMNPDQWAEKRIDLLVDLLHAMAQALDYDFDKTHIRNATYSPTAHGRIEQEQEEVREKVLELLKGERALPMFVVNMPGAASTTPEEEPSNHES